MVDRSMKESTTSLTILRLKYFPLSEIIEDVLSPVKLKLPDRLIATTKMKIVDTCRL